MAIRRKQVISAVQQLQYLNGIVFMRACRISPLFAVEPDIKSTAVPQRSQRLHRVAAAAAAAAAAASVLAIFPVNFSL